MNHYKISTGERVSKQYIDQKVREAKAKVLQNMLDEHGYIFCSECKRNDCKPVDCSHVISVDKCQKSGRAELAWSVENIKPLGRKCHQKKDKLTLFE